MIEIARQDRPSLYDHWADRPPPLVARARRLEIGGRLAGDGAEVEPLGPVDDLGLAEPDDADGAVAVCLLHADLDPSHEQTVGSALAERGFDVSCSHEVSPEFREYERTVTTVVNAYLRPALPLVPGTARAPRRRGARDDLGRRARPRRRGGRDAGPPPAVGAGGRGTGRGGDRRRQRVRRRHHLRHGRHEHRRVPGAGRPAGTGGRALGERLPDPSPVPRRAHDRGRWRLDRPPRPGRGAGRRSRVGRCGAGAGLLRPRWHRAHGHRRRPRRRPAAP